MKPVRTLMVAVVVATLLLSQRSVQADEATGPSVPILNGSVAVQALSNVAYTVKVDRSVMSDPMIVGHVEATGGTGNDIQVMVGTESAYTNWKNGHTANAIYCTGQVTAADVRAPLPESGTYVVMLSNEFSAFSPKTVTGSLRLTWTPPALSLAPGGGLHAPALALAAFLLVAGVGLLFYALWRAMHRARSNRVEPEKKAA
jgi:hypothetical protein